MKENLNYREFYHKVPFHICQNDWFAMEKNPKYAGRINEYTHWVIALEGNEIDWQRSQWRVVVFPSNEDGQFNSNLPFFQSPFQRTFDGAYELLKKIEQLAKQDQLSNLQL
ncbi:hypothetical protein M3182_08880 [Mesobacillus maritimus]|uniref:hypothetical protein n=1 Tax=Mesobacillus maritimus TaxID=1643336 RepID=UPI002040F28C|nr:hypothetical protein [Mesobacillus maritimus]MCM3585856.1 hypothetical protein [Mesobacillus maritimus]